jgi:hypothetical protein
MLNIENYRGKLRDTQLEKDLTKALRSMEGDQALSFLLKLIDVHLVAALDIAGRVLRDRKQFTALLDRGLQDSNASTIKHWINCVEPNLGTRRVINHLRSKIDEFPGGVCRSLYFIRQKVNADDSRTQESLASLIAELETRGIRSVPNIIIEDGKRLLAPIEPLPSSLENVRGDGSRYKSI